MWSQLGDREPFCKPEGQVNLCARGKGTARRRIEVSELWQGEVECAGDFLGSVSEVSGGGTEKGGETDLVIRQDSINVVV